MAHSVLRRYTPPTCTLEILATHSPLSVWTKQPVLKHLRFRLSLDDPKLLREQWVTLSGDREQLETLAEVVSVYVQRLLEQTQSRFYGALSQSSRGDSATDRSMSVVLMAAADLQSEVTTANPMGIQLQPVNLLTHRLVLGSLATAESSAAIQLSTLQLFDLANALEAFATESVSLPDLARSSWLNHLPSWGQVAAMAIVAVGATVAIARLLEGGTQIAQTTTPTSSQAASSTDQKLALQLPPSATEKVTPPVTSQQTLPAPPSPLATTSPKPELATVPVPQTMPVSPVLVPVPAPANAPAASSPVIVPGDPEIVAPRKMQAPTALPDARFESEFPRGSAPMTGENRTFSRGALSSADAGTAFDTIPQVAEARNFFQQRWQPPEGLTQTLEYTLMVNPNGTLQRIIPLGQASGDYIDRTGIPLVGEPFISPISGGRTARIRLVLSPDGKVRTFLEGVN